MEARMGQELECLIFDCYKKRKPKCCHYCATKHTCRSACMNSPDRCGMSVTREENRYEHRERMDGNDK